MDRSLISNNPVFKVKNEIRRKFYEDQISSNNSPVGLLSAKRMCADARVSPSSSNPLGDTSQPFSKEESKEEPSASEEEPTESVLEELFCDAMFEINDLATEDPQDCMRRIFSDTEVYDDDQVTIDSFAFARTSKNYSELVEYYGNIFIDDGIWMDLIHEIRRYGRHAVSPD